MEAAKLNSALQEMALLASDQQIITLLTDAVRGYGELDSITPFISPGMAQRLYLLNFRDNPSASHAAQALECQLYGYKSVMVWLPQVPKA